MATNVDFKALSDLVTQSTPSMLPTKCTTGWLAQYRCVHMLDCGHLYFTGSPNCTPGCKTDPDSTDLGTGVRDPRFDCLRPICVQQRERFAILIAGIKANPVAYSLTHVWGVSSDLDKAREKKDADAARRANCGSGSVIQEEQVVQALGHLGLDGTGKSKKDDVTVAIGQLGLDNEKALDAVQFDEKWDQELTKAMNELEVGDAA